MVKTTACLLDGTGRGDMHLPPACPPEWTHEQWNNDNKYRFCKKARPSVISKCVLLVLPLFTHDALSLGPLPSALFSLVSHLTQGFFLLLLLILLMCHWNDDNMISVMLYLRWYFPIRGKIMFLSWNYTEALVGNKAIISRIQSRLWQNRSKLTGSFRKTISCLKRKRPFFHILFCLYLLNWAFKINRSHTWFLISCISFYVQFEFSIIH